ncbi:hypothetical protein GpartN1_g1078.t1 [Galdieria partita]|uniref:Uncharacterized protein n=1 Tax=Galdieria partita TaxID=83374 RepID=A0A9C7PSS5_9RHOD|nr:hypothetical protein GpartN1_g1078.t1 [Galdieria partita]
MSSSSIKHRRKTGADHPVNALDPFTQLADVRSFERFIRQKSTTMKRLRRWNRLILLPLFINFLYWTYKLMHCVFKYPKEHVSLMLHFWKWLLFGALPVSLLMISGVYRGTVTEPALYVSRLNRVLAQFHIAYAEDLGRLLRTERGAYGNG